MALFQPKSVAWLDRNRHTIKKVKKDDNISDKEKKRRLANLSKQKAKLKKECKSFVPGIMQNIESDLMIKIIASVIYNEIPGIQILTIHDAVLIEQQHKDKVLEIISREFEMEYGVRPVVRDK